MVDFSLYFPDNPEGLHFFQGISQTTVNDISLILSCLRNQQYQLPGYTFPIREGPEETAQYDDVHKVFFKIFDADPYEFDVIREEELDVPETVGKSGGEIERIRRENYEIIRSDRKDKVRSMARLVCIRFQAISLLLGTRPPFLVLRSKDRLVSKYRLKITEKEFRHEAARLVDTTLEERQKAAGESEECNKERLAEFRVEEDAVVDDAKINDLNEDAIMELGLQEVNAVETKEDDILSVKEKNMERGNWLWLGYLGYFYNYLKIQRFLRGFKS